MEIILEYLTYPFFLRALIIGVIISGILSWLSNYIVLRQEVIFSHAISHFALLGVAFSFLFDTNMSVIIIISCIIAGIITNYLQKINPLKNDSILSILSQASLAAAIIVISIIDDFKIDIWQFLFGDILGISSSDLIISLSLSVLIIISVIIYHKKFLQISISKLLSQSAIKNKEFINILLLLITSIAIGIAIKIVGILLVAAFTTIPANASKLISKNLQQTLWISVVIGVFGTIIGLFLSAIADIPSGASIVAVLATILFITTIFRRAK